MPSVSIKKAGVYNAALRVSGVLTGDKGIPITAYTVVVIPDQNKPIQLVTNEPSSGGDFEFCGSTPENAPINLPCTIRVITNRQAQDSTVEDKYCNPLIGFIPEGSYQQTCRNIKVEMSCQARDTQGRYLQSTLDLTQLVNPNVRNFDGVLKTADGYQPQNGFQPGGDWNLSCSDTSVVLHCEAQKKDGSWVKASFALTDLGKADLWNDDGVLKNALD